MGILIEQEIALHQYEIRQNKSEVVRLLHPTFQEVWESGKSYDFNSIIEMMSREKPSSVRIHSQDYECILLEPSVQLLLYKSALVTKSGEVSHYTKRSSTWVFTDLGWQMKYHQGTECEAFELNSESSK